MPSAAPRNGPAQGVATKAASAPVPKLPLGLRLAAEHRQLERAQQVERDRGGEQQQDEDRARVLQLERPARRASAGADRQQRRAEQPGADHRARRIGQAHRAALRARRRPTRARCSAFSARIGKTHGIRLSSSPPGQRAEHREQDRVEPKLADRPRRPPAPRPGTALNLEAAPVAEREHAATAPPARRGGA